MKNQANRKLISNTVFLYLMTTSIQILNLLTVPYLSRVLGPTEYGQIGLALGYMAYVQIILDFGFTLYVTKKISENKTDKCKIEYIITAVTFIKVILAVCLGVVFLLFLYINVFDVTLMTILQVYLLGYLITALLPDFYYRGMENMKSIALRTLIVRVLFTLLIFLCVRKKEDIMFVPVCFLVGSILAFIITAADIRWKKQITFRWPGRKYVMSMVRSAFPYFTSRFASTFYQALNVIIIGKIYGTAPEVGYYTSSDKCLSLVKMGSSPIADSLYPYMLNHKNYRLIKRLLGFVMPIITVGVIIIGIYAEPICEFVFGDGYAESGAILRLLLPAAWVILPTYVVAFPVMSPMGLAKYANYSNVIGVFIQLLGLLLLFLSHRMNIYTICGLTSFTEVSVFMYRLSVVLLSVCHERNKNHVK